MRGMFLLSAVLFASAQAAHAQGWTPVPDAVAEATLQRLSKSLEDADEKAMNAAWKAVQPMLGPKGVFHGEDTIGLDDASTVTRFGVWRTGAELAKVRSTIMVLLANPDPAVCSDSECIVAASHFASTLVMRQGPAGKLVIVGVFDTNSMVDDARQAAIDASVAHWREAIDQRYPKTTTLPPITLARGDAQGRQKARSFNEQGLAALKAGDDKAAIAALTQAVIEDPAHYLARYNLACAHALAGQKAKALAILTAFKAATACPACQVRVARAAVDADFAKMKGDAAFKAIVAGATVPTPDPKGAATAVDAAFQGAGATLTPFIDPLRPVRVITKSALSGDTVTAMVDGDALPAHFKSLSIEGIPALNGMEDMTCAPVGAGPVCCTSGEQMVGHNNLYLQKVCVEADGAGWATLRSVEILDGD